MKVNKLSYKELTEKLEQEYKAYDNFVHLVRIQLINEEYTLDERWSLFKKYSGILPVSGWYHDLQALNEVGIELEHENFPYYVQKYATCSYINVVDHLEDELNPAYSGEHPEVTQEVINAVKEEVLHLGQSGFIYDW